MTDLVRKRDGRLQGYREDKLARAFLAAAGSRWSADDGPGLAAELARSISYFLFRKPSGRLGRPGRIADSGDIEAAALRALAETGHPEVAGAFQERARWRERRRGDLRLPADQRPTILDGEGEAPWSKSIVSAILDKEAGLGTEISAEIARSVEARIFAAGLRRISLTVLREFVEAELLARGLEGGLARSAEGAEPEDLERSLDLGAAQDPAAFRAELGDERLRSYIIDEVLAGAPASALRQGALAFLGLEHPLSFLALRVQAPPLVDPRESIALLAEGLRDARRLCSGPLIVELASLPEACLEVEELRWALGLVLRSCGELILRGAGPPDLAPGIARWVEEEAVETPHRPAYLVSGKGEAPRYFMGDGDAAAEVAVLNLAQCAFRAGRGERDAFLEELTSSLGVAAQGLARFSALFEARVLKPDLPLWQPEAAAEAPSLRGEGLRYGIIPAGLDTALTYLTGEGIAENTRVEELAIEVVKALKRGARKAGRAEGLALSIFDDDGRAAGLARDLARCDRAAFPQAEELFDRERGYQSGLPRPPRIRRRLARALGLRPCRALLGEAGAGAPQSGPASSAASGSSPSP